MAKKVKETAEKQGTKCRRRERREGAEALPEELKQVNRNAAGIDVGAESHWVAVPRGRDAQGVREFGAFTCDLYRLADWLEQCGIESVVMESTGVYWVNLFEVLEERGVEVLLVDARKLKNVPGRKTDVLDCQWLQQLHTFGLLSGVFRPADEVCVLRSYMRQRAMLVAYGSHHVQHMQKALTQMNVKLQHVVSDITGVTGMRIIRAIVRGQRDPKALAELRDPRCQKDKETLAKALEGHWREEHLFELQQAVALYDTYQAKIRECDERLEKSLQTFEAHPPGGGRTGPEAKGRRAKNEPGFDVAQYLFRMTGVDLTAVDGLDAHTALKVISEIGLDMGRWPGVKQFTSWLALCPGNKVSGGKRLNGRTRPSANRAASALRLAAQGLHHSDSALGAFFRRMKIRHGTPKAVTATAHRLARIIYSMLRQGSHFVHETAEEYERRYRTQQIEHMKRKAKKLGYELVKIEDPQVESLP